MAKIKFKQALKVTHNNVAQVMELPCVWMCRKLDDGEYRYFCKDKVHEGFVVEEDEWLVEIEGGIWLSYSNKQWEEMR